MISLPLVQSACPAVREFAPDAFTNWRTLRDSGRVLCAAVGINPQVRQEAQAILGPDLAASAIAITVQRSTSGVVAKPGAYLRRLVQRGRDGELHLSRSLFALAKGGAQAEPQTGRSGAPKPSGEMVISFPEAGLISFGRWGAVVREQAPRPTPDVDSVAEAFRHWARQEGLETVHGSWPWAPLRKFLCRD